ncbi:MAG: dUTP diphosphatase [Euryarchaeota archaeon]|jgi:dUTP pyrophosphatase|nr:dUTP diphosphatase [Euryarchaeota archaeon]
MMREEVAVQFTRIHEDAQAPTHGSPLAAGWDLRSVEETEVFRGASTKVKTGLKIAIPAGYEGQVRARSSLAAKGLILPNAPGTIDADYRGELMVLLTWIGEGESYTIPKGERVAQLVIAPVPDISFVEVSESELSDTTRGEGGFGSTGRF